MTKDNGSIFFFISLIIHSWVVVSNRNTYVVFLSGLASGIGLWAVRNSLQVPFFLRY